MCEFLIRRTDGDWFDLPYDQLPKVLHPNSVPYKPISGWGCYRIEVLGCEISFSDEDPGIAVCFEDETLSEVLAQRLTEEICQNIMEFTGQSGEVIQVA
jgi:hypothetical protein